MAIPKYNELFGAFLRALQDGEVHTLQEVKTHVAKEKQLTETDLAEMLPSGKQPMFSNRLGWARAYLKKAGLIDSPVRAKYVLTVEGKKVLPQADEIDNEFLMQYPSFVRFITHTEIDGFNFYKVNNPISAADSPLTMALMAYTNVRYEGHALLFKVKVTGSRYNTSFPKQ